MRGNERAEWILEAARRILASDGPDGLTVHRIAERAGLSVGSLYRHFPSKEAVVEAVIDREVAAALAAYEHTELDFGDRNLAAQLELMFEEAITRLRGLARLHPEFTRLHPRRLSVTTASAEGRARMRQLVERMLLFFRAELRPDLDLESVVFLLTDGIASLLQAAVRDRPELLDLDTFGPSLAQLFYRYLTSVGEPAPAAVPPASAPDGGGD